MIVSFSLIVITVRRSLCNGILEYQSNIYNNCWCILFKWLLYLSFGSETGYKAIYNQFGFLKNASKNFDAAKTKCFFGILEFFSSMRKWLNFFCCIKLGVISLIFWYIVERTPNIHQHEYLFVLHPYSTVSIEAFTL